MRFSIRRLMRFGLFLVVAPAAFATSWYVNGVSGSDSNNCLSPTTACKTIGNAISLASSGDSIMVAPATYTENLIIGISLKVIGSGATTTIIDGGGIFSVVTISFTTAHVSLSKVTIQNGHASDGGGIWNNGVLTVSSAVISGNTADATLSEYGCGGGIFNTGTLTINDSIVSGNVVEARYPSGGGIYSQQGTLSLNKTTVNGNSATPNISCGTIYPCGAVGGGITIELFGTANITNSTVSGNSAVVSCGKNCGAAGGGIYVYGTLLISNGTISGNSTQGGLFDSGAAGGGIYGFGTSLISISSSTISENSAGVGRGISGVATLQNSIMANSSENCAGTITSNGYNLSSDGSCHFSNTGDLNNTNPKLGPLENNGGPTQTQALLPGSPAIDAGNPSGCTDSQGHLLKTDQRGKPRPDKEDTGGCDMGAYERQSD